MVSVRYTRRPPPFVRAMLRSAKHRDWRRKRLKQQGGVCHYCRKPLAEDAATLDHVVPLSKGGYDHWENVVAACGPCNQRKGASEASARSANPPSPSTENGQ
jgi:5-methylcytosine-specific restriction endonuclease McrA